MSGLSSPSSVPRYSFSVLTCPWGQGLQRAGENRLKNVSVHFFNQTGRKEAHSMCPYMATRVYFQDQVSDISNKCEGPRHVVWP